MSPVGGQGINIALRDSLVAANHLVPALEGGGDLDAAARAFEAERRHEVATVQRMQRIPPRIIFRESWWARALVAVLPRIAPLLAGPARAGISRFALGVDPVELSV